MQLRFIFPCLPLLDIAAACALARLWLARRKSTWRRLLAFSALASLLASAALAGLFAAAAHHNYPGASQPFVAMPSCLSKMNELS